MRKLASIQKITKIEPILNADQIELAHVLGWKVIIRKEDEYKVNDLVVYIQYDTVLPVKPEFEFLRSCCYSKKYDGFRIKNRRLRGVFSEGIIFPLSILSKFIKIKEDYDVTDILDIRKYDPESLLEVELIKKKPIIKYFMKYKWFRKLFPVKPKTGRYPPGIIKASEDNIQVVFNKAKQVPDSFYKTEKLEGQNAVFAIIDKKFMVFSHNTYLKNKSNNNWWRIAIKLDIEKKMKLFMKKEKIKTLYISGEIVGPNIQQNVYKLNDLDFYLYTMGDTKGSLYSFYYMINFCTLTKIKFVPIIEEFAMINSSVDQILKDCEGYSMLNPKTKREGLVWRTYDNSFSFKVKSKDYQTWFNKKDVTI